MVNSDNATYLHYAAPFGKKSMQCSTTDSKQFTNQHLIMMKYSQYHPYFAHKFPRFYQPINKVAKWQCMTVWTGVWRTGASTVPAAPPIKYVLCYRSRNPNPITDPNLTLKITKKRKWHRNEIEHRVISKSRFPRDAGGFMRPITGNGRQTHMDLHVS